MASTKEEEEVSSKAEVEEEKEKDEAFQANKGKSKGKGNVLARVFHDCGKPGHHESQCRKKERDLGGVREVQEEDEKSSGRAAASIATTMRTANSSSSAAQAKASAAGTRSVRQIAMCHMAEPEEDSKVFHWMKEKKKMMITLLTTLEELKSFHFAIQILIASVLVKSQRVMASSKKETILLCHCG